MTNAVAVPIFPQKPVFAVVGILAITVLLIGAMKLAGFKPEASIPASPPQAQRVLHVEDGEQGRVTVRDANTGQEIKTFLRAEGSFVRAALRALVNDRRKKGLPLAGNFRLELHKGQQLYLIDEPTGRTLSLNAFGPANTAVFAAFMSNQKGEGQ